MEKGELAVSSSRQMEFIDLTAQLNQELAAAGIQQGVCVVYNPHTTAGLTINEGADPAVQKDLLSVLKKLVPLDHPYQHAEGNSPAHMMASLMGSSVTVFVHQGRLQLGTWQKVFFCEFDGPRSRRVFWRVTG